MNDFSHRLEQSNLAAMVDVSSRKGTISAAIYHYRSAGDKIDLRLPLHFFGSSSRQLSFTIQRKSIRSAGFQQIRYRPLPVDCPTMADSSVFLVTLTNDENQPSMAVWNGISFQYLPIGGGGMDSQT